MIGPGQINRPEVVAEVLSAFCAYERALLAGDAAALDAAFWDSPDVVRFGIADRQKGSRSISQWRSQQGPLTGRQLRDTVVSTFGADTAVVTTLFGYPGRAVEGRQSQTWIRTGEGWRIVSAHVSEVGPGGGEDG